MSLLSALLGHASEFNANIAKAEYGRLLADGETVEAAFKLVRDVLLFTNRRLILIDKQGMTGRKIEYLSLPYRSIVVASTDDPYCPSRRAGAYARAWGSEFVRLPDAGHINVASGHGEWPLGLALLHSLMASTPASPFDIAG